MIWLFVIMAVVAFVAFGYHAARRDGHGMVYAAVICLVWIAAALWWSGMFGR